LLQKHILRLPFSALGGRQFWELLDQVRAADIGDEMFRPVDRAAERFGIEDGDIRLAPRGESLFTLRRSEPGVIDLGTELPRVDQVIVLIE